MNSPRRTLLKITWYLCLLTVLIGAVPTLSFAQELIAPPVRLHKHHWKPAHHLYFRSRPVYTGITAPGQSTYPAPADPESAATLMAPSTTANAPIRKRLHVRLGMRRPTYARIVVPREAHNVVKDKAPAAVTVPAVASQSDTTTTSGTTPATVPALPVNDVAIPATKPVSKVATPLDMTRDAVIPPAQAPGKTASEGVNMNVVMPISKMLGATLLVLVVVFGVVKVLQKFNIVPNTANNVTAHKPSITAPMIAAIQPTALSIVPNLKRPKAVTGTTFELLSTLNLPDSAASIHLVRAAEKMLVLSTTHSGTGVTMLTELGGEPVVAPPTADLQNQWIKKQDNASEEAISVFSEILREQAAIAAVSDRADLRVVDRVETRLSATQEKLNARLKAGAELSSAVLAVTPSPTRRRTSKAAAAKAVDTK